MNYNRNPLRTDNDQKILVQSQTKEEKQKRIASRIINKTNAYQPINTTQRGHSNNSQ
jgi:hypothetical protein